MDKSYVKKTDIVRQLLAEGNYKKALSIAKDFRLNISREQSEAMCRAYECMVHPEFYKQIGYDIANTIEKGKKVIDALYGS